MKKWERSLISPNTSINQTIKTIDSSSTQIALVVDENRKLLGTVTDGDIRRGILKGINLEEPVQKIMKQNPITVKDNEKREKIISLMAEKHIRHLPVVDGENRIVDLELLEDLIQSKKKENIVVLMAGGLGTRLRPLTDNCPKPLLMVGDKPILETILQNFIDYGFYKFFISVNYKDEMVKDYFGNGRRWNVDINYIDEHKQMGTAGALGLLPEKPKESFLVMNGDLLTKINFQQLLDFHTDHKVKATMCVREYDFQVPYGVVQLDDERIINIDEKPIQKFFVNAGIYVFEPEILKQIPQDTYIDMPDLFRNLIKSKNQVTTFPVREYWLDIGRMEDLARANGEFASTFNTKQ